MQLHCEMQDINEGSTKEDRQGRGLDKGAQHSRGPSLKTQLKEDSVTTLSDTSKTNNRYGLSLRKLFRLDTERLTVFTSRRKTLCRWIALWIILQVPRLFLQIQRDNWLCVQSKQLFIIVLVVGTYSSPIIAISDKKKAKSFHILTPNTVFHCFLKVVNQWRGGKWGKYWFEFINSKFTRRIMTNI